MKFHYLAQRLFNTPLAIHPAKAEVVMGALAERLGIAKITRPNGQIVIMGSESTDPSDSEFDDPGANPRVGYEVLAGVAIIEIEGTLVQRLGTLQPYSGMTGYDGIRQNLAVALADPSIRAVMLRINSPGGEVCGCFDLVDAIYKARGSKPIWAILDESAYSAAYAIASAADRVIVPRTGGTGSIGVIWVHVDWSKALSEAGLAVSIIQYGDRKADGHPEIPLSGEARARFQADINTMGKLFSDTTARNRRLSASKVRAMQANTYLGQLGVAQGLADAVMAPDAAFRSLLAKLG